MIYDYFIDIVGACNLSCPSCPTGNFQKIDYSGQKRLTGFMEIKTFSSIISKIAEYQDPTKTSLHLYNWGEPLLHPKLDEILKLASGKDYKIFISSNLNTTNNLSPLLDNRVNFLRISNSGYYQDTYKRTHRRGNINLVKSNMYQLRHLIDKKNSNIDVELCYHMYKSNTGKDYIKMKELCDELDFRFAPIIANFVSVEKVMQFLKNEIRFQDKEIIENLLLCINEAIKISNRKKSKSCELYSNQIIINFDGSTSLCCGVYDPIYSLHKNILRDSISDIQKSKNKFSKYCDECMDMGIHNYLMAKNGTDLKNILHKRYNLGDV